MRRRGEVLPKSLIASQVWDMNFDSDTNVIEVAFADCGPRLMTTSRQSSSIPPEAWATDGCSRVMRPNHRSSNA
jgi:hypothetical protein